MLTSHDRAAIVTNSNPTRRNVVSPRLSINVRKKKEKEKKEKKEKEKKEKKEKKKGRSSGQSGWDRDVLFFISLGAFGRD
ncbi:hypothetical protein FMUND_12873 [Fusarium mundagurra]|uniref:Uncharacterized protein n=1 Tax=Fusarium mundagurra TaxID=1567541 RepID=A0A8H5Y0Q5_9HYPO|nr:hypothetical protein FMUND_12873 [Fusarium mundagurra]